MNFKVHLDSWLDEIKTKYGYSHIEKAFTHLYIREFRDDHELSEKFIRDHVVDNANDLGVDAIYVNDKDDLILIQSKYSYGDALLKKEIDKADSFISKYYGVNGRKENLLDKANSALKKILSLEVFTRNIKEVRFIYLCGSFSKEITSTLKNLEAKFQNIPQDFYLDMYDITLLDELYDPYSVENQCDINIIGNKYYEHPEHDIEIEDFKEYKIRTKALVFTGQASSLKVLYEKWGDSLFEANVRNFLSFRKPINKSIKLEVEKTNRSNLWYYNNGLVAICEGYENKGTHVDAKNLQIVNGGQTVRTLANVKFVEGSLGVNVKLISVENSSELPSDVRKQFMTELAVNSNKQNPISTRDLKSNDIIQRELQKRFKEYNWFLQIKAGEEKIDDWKEDLKKKGNSVMNSTIVGYFISFFLQKTNASSGRTSLAFLDEEDGDEIMNYSNIFGNKGEYDQTFRKHLLSFFLARKIEDYTKRDIIQQQFPFHANSTNMILALMGYWIYLNEKESERQKSYVEEEVRDFLNGKNFDVLKYINLDKSSQTIGLNFVSEIDKLLDFYTEKIHDKLSSEKMENQPRKIYNKFKAEGSVKEFSDYVRPTLMLRNLLINN